jgi:5-formyltetrahydrofolate cyclo-ligase
MTKKQLRDQYKLKRAALSGPERLRAEDLLLIQFQQLEISFDTNILLSYWPLLEHAEPNTHLLTDYLRFRLPELQIAYPVTDFTNHSMQVYLTDDSTQFEINEYGIAEPVNGIHIESTAIDLVFVPLLVFDKTGHRVGFGKGFYDRFLPNCREDIVKIGFSFFEPVDVIEGITQFDVPLSIGVTPHAIYEF